MELNITEELIQDNTLSVPSAGQVLSLAERGLSLTGRVVWQIWTSLPLDYNIKFWKNGQKPVLRKLKMTKKEKEQIKKQIKLFVFATLIHYGLKPNVDLINYDKAIQLYIKRLKEQGG